MKTPMHFVARALRNCALECTLRAERIAATKEGVGAHLDWIQERARASAYADAAERVEAGLTLSFGVPKREDTE